MWGMFTSSCGGKDSASSAHLKAGGTQLNDAVYLLHDTGTAQPDVELVFIHGLRVTEDKDAFWTTWLTLDGTMCWPATWLKRGEGFPMAARVLSLNYDASFKKKNNEGRFNLHSLGESLLQQMYLLDAKVGQNNCPVVFVCHSLGGIVAKKIVLTAKHSFPRDEKAQNLLRNLKGFFFYATPHSGSKLFEKVCNVSSSKRGPLLTCLKELETGTHRLNDEFCRLKDNEFKGQWRFRVAAESVDTKVNGVTVKALKYATAKHIGIDKFVEVEEADHFTVCKPASKTSTSFQFLKEFVEEIHRDFPPTGLQ